MSFVVPRYGTEILGGAESAARMIAEHLVAQKNWEVEVITTCALDHITWENKLNAGMSELNGVLVKRFVVDRGREEKFFELDAKVKVDPLRLTLGESKDWVELQGPISVGLLEEIARCDSEVVAFYPYLFHPTVEGVKRVKGRKILHPAVHDEPAFYLKVFDETFKSFDGFVYHASAERKLTQRVIQIAQKPQITLGLGTSDPHCTGSIIRDKFQLGTDPYIVSLGRIDEMKGSVFLAEFFIEYKKAFPSECKLLFVGPDLVKLPSHKDIVCIGPVTESDKWDLLSGAELLISPSAYESFSLVIFEAWKSSIPVLVNGSCEVTLEHCIASRGGLWFENFKEFCVKLHAILTNRGLRDELAGNGREYAISRYNWEILIERYCEFAERIVKVGR